MAPPLTLQVCNQDHAPKSIHNVNTRGIKQHPSFLIKVTIAKTFQFRRVDVHLRTLQEVAAEIQNFLRHSIVVLGVRLRMILHCWRLYPERDRASVFYSKARWLSSATGSSQFFAPQMPWGEF